MILSDGTVFKFKKGGSGLYYYDMAGTGEHISAKTNATITLYSMLLTVTKNKQFNTRANIEGSDRARIYRVPLGWPRII